MEAGGTTEVEEELLVPLLPDLPLPLPPDLPDFPEEEEEDHLSSRAGAASHPSETRPSKSLPLFCCVDERERLMRLT